MTKYCRIFAKYGLKKQLPGAILWLKQRNLQARSILCSTEGYRKELCKYVII